METKDHFRLAKWFLRQERNRLPHTFSAGLIVGSVLPDCNPFTYLSGVRRGQGLHGHNAEVTEKKICSLLAAGTDAESFLSGVRLGTALHYLADAFTYPHHNYYPGTLADHVAYERSLHRTFTAFLSETEPSSLPPATDFPAYFADMLSLYRQIQKNEQTDCRFITQMCGMAFAIALAPHREEEAADPEPDCPGALPLAR